MPTISKTWRSNRNTLITLMIMINIHTGLAENGLENLPCPSSLLLGVLVTLLPKVSPDFSFLHKWVYLLTHICFIKRQYHFHKSLSKDGSPADAVLPGFRRPWSEVSFFRSPISSREWGGFQVSARALYLFLLEKISFDHWTITQNTFLVSSQYDCFNAI